MSARTAAIVNKIMTYSSLFLPRRYKLYRIPLLLLLILFCVLYMIYPLNKTQYEDNHVIRSSVEEDGPIVALLDKLTWRENADILASGSPVKPKVLIIATTMASPFVQGVMEVLEYTRMKYDVHLAQNPLLGFNTKANAIYKVVVFQNIETYARMNKGDRDILDTFCKDNHVGIVMFCPPNDRIALGNNMLPFTGEPVKNAHNYTIKAKPELLRIMKPDVTFNGSLEGDVWTCFQFTNPTYSAIASIKHKKDDSDEYSECTSAVYDSGSNDGIRKFIFGNGLQFSFEHILFLDGLSFLTKNVLSTPLERYVNIDVDDTLRVPDDALLYLEDIKVSHVQFYYLGFPLSYCTLIFDLMRSLLYS